MNPGCTGAVKDGVLYLTLDTPGSSVNIFTPAIAKELDAQLSRGLARGVRAVVLASAKPGSFVNGVGLLLASSMSASRRATQARALRRVYDRLARARVPTIAAIEGNCYGCGLELALTCDYRVASSGFEAHFYMPEIADYCFMPLLGGTVRLPRLVGLEPAADLLIFGKRMAPAAALGAGLVDQVLEPERFQAGLRAFVDDAALRGKPRRTPAPPVREVRSAVARKIAALPPRQRPLAHAGLRLMAAAMTAPARAAMQDELETFLETVESDDSRRATSFFFIRQAAKAHSIRTTSYIHPRGLSVAIASGLPRFRELLLSRRLTSVVYREVGPADVTFVPPGGGQAGACTVILGRGAGPAAPAGATAYLALPGAASPVVEIVGAGENVATLFHFLEHAGFCPVVTSARGRFLSDRILDAYLAPAARSGLAENAIDGAMFQFGFSVLPTSLGARSTGRGRAAKSLVPDTLRSLGEEAVRALDEKVVSHPSQFDLLAQLLLGFPVSRGSLLRHLAAKGGAWPRFYG